jgi:hypothetical protein
VFGTIGGQEKILLFFPEPAEEQNAGTGRGNNGCDVERGICRAGMQGAGTGRDESGCDGEGVIW